MKRLSLVCGPLLLAALSAGCTSTQGAMRDGPLMQRETQIDQVYVAYVDGVAKQRGTRVVWVNPPKRTVIKPIASTN